PYAPVSRSMPPASVRSVARWSRHFDIVGQATAATAESLRTERASSQVAVAGLNRSSPFLSERCFALGLASFMLNLTPTWAAPDAMPVTTAAARNGTHSTTIIDRARDPAPAMACSE